MGHIQYYSNNKMPTIKSNTEELKIGGSVEYRTLFNDTLEEYDKNMRERFDGESLDYVDVLECWYYEVGCNHKTDNEALEAIGTNCNALAVSQMIMGMTKEIVKFHKEMGNEIDPEDLTGLGSVYTMWREAIMTAVGWEESYESDEEDED